MIPELVYTTLDFRLICSLSEEQKFNIFLRGHCLCDIRMQNKMLNQRSKVDCL